MASLSSRAGMLAAPRIIIALWTHGRVTFEGRYHRVCDARCEPRPNPVSPVVVGASPAEDAARHGGARRLVGRVIQGPESYRQLAQQFDSACAAIGRDPSVRRSWSGGCACARTQAEAEALTGDRVSAHNEDDFGFVGTPERIIEQMRQFVALGVTYFAVDCSGFPVLTTLITKVVPAVTRPPPSDRQQV